MLCSHTKLHYSQTTFEDLNMFFRFAPLQNYTTLKRSKIQWLVCVGFAPLQNYTTLKLGNMISLVLCQYLVQVKMRNFSHFNPPEAQPQCVFFYTIVRIHLVTYSYNGYEFVSYCRKLPDIRKSSSMPACNREF